MWPMEPGEAGRDRFGRVMAALGHRYRRGLLLALLDRDRRADDPRDAVELLVARLGGVEDTGRLRIQPRHCHLPKREEQGCIRWDRETGAVSRGPTRAELAPVLESVEDCGDERRRRSLCE